MKVMTLDPKATHRHNPDCPSRLAPMPGGGWMCVDCGFQLIQKMIDTTDPSESRTAVISSIERLRKLGAELKAVHGRPPVCLGSGVLDDDPQERQAEHRDMALKRAEEGVSTTHEHTPPHSELTLEDVRAHARQVQNARLLHMLETWEGELKKEMESGSDSMMATNIVLGRVKQILYSEAPKCRRCGCPLGLDHYAQGADVECEECLEDHR